MNEMFLQGLNKRLARFVMGLSRKHLRNWFTYWPCCS